MKTLQDYTKTELIEYIQQLQPKAEAYEKVCKQLGVEEFSIGVDRQYQKFNVGVICQDYEDFINWKISSHFDYSQSNRYWFDVISGTAKIRYFAICSPSRLIGLRINMIVETDQAKNNKEYETILMHSKASLS